jgi:hypothetical protein
MGLIVVQSPLMEVQPVVFYQNESNALSFARHQEGIAKTRQRETIFEINIVRM